MLIRTELLRPSPQLFGAGGYLTIVGIHGAMMMGIMTSGVLGPFANYFVPLQIGARRMAFPRIEALSFWLLMAAGTILTSSIFFGGFPTGWTGYGPLNDEANFGYDSYIFFFALVGISMTLLGLNLIATIVTMRAPGLTWSRLPIFCWGAISTSALMVLAAPVLIAVLLMVAFDRTVQTSFFLTSSGGSPYLFENLFWFFGHPEVYVLALPGFGILLEILPVFARKPLWGYRLAVAGMLGVALLSFFVWQHHLFVSGINGGAAAVLHALDRDRSRSRPGSSSSAAWRRCGGRAPASRCRCCSAWPGSSTSSSAASPESSSRTPRATSAPTAASSSWPTSTTRSWAGLVFTFFAAIYYWVPKMFGVIFNERLAKIHFWSMFLAFNATFAPLFALGLMGMPRRVSTYASNLQGLNIWVSVCAFILGVSMLVFLFNVVYSLVFVRKPAEENPWHSKSLEWQTPTPVPLHNFDEIPVIDHDPYDYGTPPPRGEAHQTTSRGPG